MSCVSFVLFCFSALDGHWSDKVESRNSLYKVVIQPHQRTAHTHRNRSINLFFYLFSRSIYRLVWSISHTPKDFFNFSSKKKIKKKIKGKRPREKDRKISSLSNCCGAQSPLGQSSTFTAVSDPLPPTRLLLLAQTRRHSDIMIMTIKLINNLLF